MTATRLKATILGMVILCGLCLAGAPERLSAQQPGQQSRVSWDGIYSDAQATRGQALYASNCASCHGKDLAGTRSGPALAGAAFAGRWTDKPIAELLEYIQIRMPYNSPGGLSRTQNTDILAFMLRQDKHPAGKQDLIAEMPIGEGSATRGEAFYTAEQAARGRIAFDRSCSRCHSTAPGSMTQEQMNKTALPSTLGGHFLERVYFGKAIYPSVFHLFKKLESMPAFDTQSITADTRTDIIAHILQANRFPSGATELTPDPDAMKNMMLNEPGFEHIFNGKDFAGMKFNIGPGCAPAPEGCGKTAPGAMLRVENGRLICACNIHSYWYTDRKYLNFTLRFQHKFPKPADWEGDDDLFMGGGGALLFIQDNYRVWPKSIEVEGRTRDWGFIFLLGGGKGKFTYDNDAKTRVIRGFDQWNDVEIVSKDGQVKSFLNGVLVSTVTEHDYKAGHIGFQMEGTLTEWRNIRVRPE